MNSLLSAATRRLVVVSRPFQSVVSFQNTPPLACCLKLSDTAQSRCVSSISSTTTTRSTVSSSAANSLSLSALERGFSSMSLRRPPQRQDSPDPTSSKSKLRTHAVSLNIGDYTDHNTDDIDREAARLREQEEWGGQEKTLAQQAQQIQSEDSALRKRWLENAKAPVRVPTIDERGRAFGRGGRKTASASVWIQPGMGHVVVNRKDFVDYFERLSDRELILAPLAATKTCGLFDVIANVQGGGLTGQAGAIRHGLARALNHYNPDVYRPPLKRLGFLTRDPRKVERKKIGHKKARKKPQWVKR